MLDVMLEDGPVMMGMGPVLELVTRPPGMSKMVNWPVT